MSRRVGGSVTINPSITLTVYAHLISNTDARAAEIVETAFASTLADERNANTWWTRRVTIRWKKPYYTRRRKF